MSAISVDENIEWNKSIAVQSWLVGYVLTDTIMVVTEKVIYFLASKKRIKFLRQVWNSIKNENGLPSKFELHARDQR